jgi:glucose-1-phosphate adenylyltransferase
MHTALTSSGLSQLALMQDAMIMGADYYEAEEARDKLISQGRVPIGIGNNTTISNTIVDKNARIGDNCNIVNKDGIDEANRESEGFYIRSGIVTVLRNAEIKSGTEL